MQEASEALHHIDPSDRNTRLTVCAALYSEFGDDARPVYLDWAGNDAGEQAKWRWARKAKRVSIASLFHLALQSGWVRGNYEPVDPRIAIDRRKRIEQEAAKEEAERQANAVKAARTASQMWSISKNPGPHPYLDHKKISDELALYCGARQYNDTLLIPAYMIDDVLKGPATLIDVQRIIDGKKLFGRGGTGATGKAMVIPGSQRLSVVEGWATGVARFAATGDTVIVSFTADNSVTASYTARRVFPSRHITYVADNDKSGAGQARALQVAAVVDQVYMPKVVDTDFWDEWQQGV